MDTQINDDLPYNSPFIDYHNSQKLREEHSSLLPKRLKQQPPRSGQSTILTSAWILEPSTSVGHAIRFAYNRLTEADISTALPDAYAILAYLFQQNQAWICANFECILNNEQALLYTSLISSRAQGVPLTTLFSCPSESLRYPLS